MASKNPNPQVISSSDARIEGQLQIEDSVVIDPRPGGSGNPVVLTATGNNLSINNNTIATLDENGDISLSNLPAISLVNVSVVASQSAQLALDADEGDVVVRSDQNVAYMHNGGTADTMADWTQISFVPVTSVAGKTGAVTLAKADITDFAHTHAKADITDFAHTHAKADITDFAHTHTASEITDLNSRQTLTQTITVAAGAEASVSLPLAKAFGMWKLSTDKEARIRFYSTSADRTADASRAEGVEPDAGVGLISEVITTSTLLSLPLTPPQFGASLETTPSANISALVKNKSASADISLTIVWTPLG